MCWWPLSLETIGSTGLASAHLGVKIILRSSNGAWSK